MRKRRLRQRRRSRPQQQRRAYKNVPSTTRSGGCSPTIHGEDFSVQLHLAQAPTATAAPIYWSPTRLQILEWLERHSVPLAELYKAAVELVFGDPFPARIRLIGHCVREIRNGLPYAVATERLPKRGRFDYPQEADGLAEIWQRTGLSLAGDMPRLDTASEASAIPSSPDERIPISRDLFEALGRFLADHQAVSVKQEQAALCLFEACSATPASDRQIPRPVVRGWLRVTETFMELTHESGKALSDADEAEMRSHFDEFEGYLASFSRSFFENLEELNAILEDTNSPTD